MLYGVITYLIFNFLHLNKKKVQCNNTQDKGTLLLLPREKREKMSNIGIICDMICETNAYPINGLARNVLFDVLGIATTSINRVLSKSETKL